MDGSAKDFVEVLQSVKFVQQNEDRNVLDISRPEV